MNYHHAYHVGSIADVVKHNIILLLIQTLQEKPAGITYLETHAAKALYDLRSLPSLKTQECESGIKTFYKHSNLQNSPKDYLELIKRYNRAPECIFYPGSALIARNILREQDDEILCELHPETYQALHDYFRHDKNVHVHLGDGYSILSSLIPPKTSRGLMLIDPPYEMKNEFAHLLLYIKKMTHQWRNGVYAIWFPIKDPKNIHHFYQQLKSVIPLEFLCYEFYTTEEKHSDNNRLLGSGMVIINPPWKFQQALSPLLETLKNALTPSNTPISYQLYPS